MDDEKRTLLVQIGVDVDGGLDRFMGNEALFLKCLRRFPADTSFQQLEEALSAGPPSRLRRCPHPEGRLGQPVSGGSLSGLVACGGGPAVRQSGGCRGRNACIARHLSKKYHRAVQ